LFISFYFYFFLRGTPLSPTGWILFIPLLVLQMALLSLGFGILVSSLTTKYKDLRLAMNFLVQLWMYATPVVYPLSQVPDWLRGYYTINPMVALVEIFRLAFFGTSAIRVEDIVVSWIVTLICLFCGVVLFSRIEKTFMDTV